MIPPGLGKLLGKIQALRNPQFSNRELAAISHAGRNPEQLLKLGLWATDELQKPFSQPMTRRGFFEAVGSIPGKAKKAQVYAELPGYERLRNVYNEVEREYGALVEPPDGWDSIYFDAPDLEGPDYDLVDQLADRMSALQGRLQGPEFEAVNRAFGRPTDWDNVANPIATAGRDLNERLMPVNPHPHPYEIPSDVPNRRDLIAQWEAVEHPALKQRNAAVDALNHAIAGEFEALDLPEPEPAIQPPAPGPQEPAPPAGPSFMDRYKKRFGIR